MFGACACERGFHGCPERYNELRLDDCDNYNDAGLTMAMDPSAFHIYK